MTYEMEKPTIENLEKVFRHAIMNCQNVLIGLGNPYDNDIEYVVLGGDNKLLKDKLIHFKTAYDCNLVHKKNGHKIVSACTIK